MDGGRRKDIHSNMISVDGGTEVGRRRNPVQGRRHDYTAAGGHRLTTSMNEGQRNAVNGSSCSSARSRDGPMPVKTKVTDGGVRLSKMNLLDRSAYSKGMSMDGGKMGLGDIPSHIAAMNLMERAYRNGCSMDAGFARSAKIDTQNARRMAAKTEKQEHAARQPKKSIQRELLSDPAANSVKQPAKYHVQDPRSNRRKVANLDLRKGSELPVYDPERRANVDRMGKPGQESMYLRKKAADGSFSLTGKCEVKKQATAEEEVKVRSIHAEMDIAECVAEAVNARVKAADMASNMQVHAFRCARSACDNPDSFSSKQLAFTLKKEFDKAYGPAWHCIVGTSFGSFVTHSVGGFLYFSMENVSILLFKTAVEPISQ
eukprot:Gb_19478 [translate_table: standard]